MPDATIQGQATNSGLSTLQNKRLQDATAIMQYCKANNLDFNEIKTCMETLAVSDFMDKRMSGSLFDKLASSLLFDEFRGGGH